jgi:hypothetical protein
MVLFCVLIKDKLMFAIFDLVLIKDKLMFAIFDLVLIKDMCPKVRLLDVEAVGARFDKCKIWCYF